MRVLVSTTAGDGHFGPLAHVARACVAAGHHVRVAAPASYGGAVRRAGLEHVPLPDVPDHLIGPVWAKLPKMDYDDANATVMREVFGRLDAQHALRALQALIAEWRPDVILRESAEFGSLAAAEAAGIPHREVAIGVAAVMRWAWTHLVEPLAELDALSGLPDGHLGQTLTSTPIFTTVPPTFDQAGMPSPAGDGPPTIRYRVDRVETNSRLPAPWGDAEHPLTYVTFGTVTGGLGHLAGIYPATLAALAGLPIRVLMTTGHAGGNEVPQPWPTNAHVEKFWPQDHVMPHASVIVSHGGFGTIMSALAAGVPQVVVPLFTTDQRLNARQVAAVGAGKHLSGDVAALATVADAVTDVLADPAHRYHASQIAAEIALLPSLTNVVHKLEQSVPDEHPVHPGAGS